MRSTINMFRLAVSRFVVVEQTPEEIALDRHAFRDCPMQVGEKVTEVHHSVAISDLAIGRELVIGRAAILGDE